MMKQCRRGSTYLRAENRSVNYVNGCFAFLPGHVVLFAPFAGIFQVKTHLQTNMMFTSGDNLIPDETRFR